MELCSVGEATYMKILANRRVLCKGPDTGFSIFYLLGVCLLEVCFLVSAIVCVYYFIIISYCEV